MARVGGDLKRKRNKLKALHPLWPGFSASPTLQGAVRVAPTRCLLPLVWLEWHRGLQRVGGARATEELHHRDRGS